jgi:hypothetical protein
MAIGINVSICVSDIDKSRISVGSNGKKYLNISGFLNNEKSTMKNGAVTNNNGFVSHEQTQQEREAKTLTSIVGNVAVFWDDSNTFNTRKDEQQQGYQQQPASQSAGPNYGQANDLDQEIPF